MTSDQNHRMACVFLSLILFGKKNIEKWLFKNKTFFSLTIHNS